jgi:hypothetical protein
LSKTRVNVIGPTIEVASIDERHHQPGLLKEFGTKIILRLGIEPVCLPPGVFKRMVVVDRISPASEEARWEELREIGWANLNEPIADCKGVRLRLNEHDITEQAAIGVMLLLIHELERAVLTTVLQVGAGGDYLVKLSGRLKPVQVEVSGIKIGSGGTAATRLGKKREQVRGPGFVSVTAFQHGETVEAHSYLHFLTPGSHGKGARPNGPKGKKRRRS